MPEGVLNDAVTPAPSAEIERPLPATEETLPASETERMRLFAVSATRRSPDALNATPPME